MATGHARFVLGFDGGGTGTRCAVLTIDGALPAVAHGGPSNFQRIGAEQAAQNVRDVALAALDQAGLTPPAVAGALCLAGLGRPCDRELMYPILQALGLADQTLLYTDADAALAGAHALGPGVVVMAGTGATAWGADAEGRRVRSDGWGPILGDEGSGYWIGREALRAVMRARDGRGEATALTEAVLAHFGLQEPWELVRRLPLAQTNTEDISALAVVCAETAQTGDAVAEAILVAAGTNLAQSGAAAATQLGMAAPSVAVTGSVLTNPVVRRQFTRHLGDLCPGSIVLPPRFPPVIGAALLALQHTGATIDAALLSKLPAAL